ncbi:MAG: SDR family oxidoreductase [Bacteroidota bacterium]|nr:SDR family oxidoreductase [Bacteroidota bacterium]
MDKKVVIITGASSGIGKSLSELYAKHNCKVVMAARNIEKITEMSKLFDSMNVENLAVQTDVSIEKECENLIAKTLEKFGKIDYLINNAGISMRALFKDLDLEVLKKLMDVNFWGTVYCIKYALPHILKEKGSITGVISVAGHVGLPGRTGYSASKFAIRGFLDTLRIEHLKDGLHVLVVAPGFTASNVRKVALTANGNPQGETPRNESGMMSPEVVAKKIANAIEKRKRSLVLTFIEGKVTVFLGKFFPRLLDKLTYNHMAKEPNSPFK